MRSGAASRRPLEPGTRLAREFSAPLGGPTTLIGPEFAALEPPSRAAGKRPDPQAPIRAAKPLAAAQTPPDPTGERSQEAEKAIDGRSTSEKKRDEVAEIGRHPVDRR